MLILVAKIIVSIILLILLGGALVSWVYGKIMKDGM